MNAPIFIVGANRSGTTLLRLMLNAHSRIAIPEEMNYFKSELAGVSVDDWHAPGLSDTQYRRFVQETLDANPTLFEHLDRATLEATLLTDAPHDLRRPFADLIEAWADAQGKPRWGEKTPGNLFFVDVILDMFPDAHFVHVVRDPRAGVGSMQNVDFFPDNVYFNAMSRRKHDRVARTMRTRVPPSQWTALRYEALVADPASELRRLCAFLGEAFEPQMLQFHRDSAQYMKDTAAASFNVAATRPVTADRTEKWKDELSPREVAIIESLCSPEMKEYDYSPSGSPMRVPDRVGLLVHTGYWALQQWRHRHVREYTVKSPLLARSRRRFSGWLAQWFPSVAARLHP